MDNLATDILLERRHEFSVGGKIFHIAPPSLGKLFVLQNVLGNIGINEKSFAAVPQLELLRIAEDKPRECCEMIAYATCDTREELCNVAMIEERTEHFAAHLDKTEIATLLVVAISTNKHHQWMADTGIMKEREKMARVAKCKQQGGSVSFGGKTIFGQMIDPAMERYGWTYEYCVWGISAAVLEILQNDKVTEIFLTDEERKSVPKHLLETEPAIKADDPDNMEKILSMNWK